MDEQALVACCSLSPCAAPPLTHARSRGNATKEAATKLLQQGFAEVPLAELPAAFAARSRVLWSRQAAHRFRRAPILQRL